MDEDPVLSTDVRLALIFFVPTPKNLKGHFERAYCVCFVRYFICFFFSQWLETLFGVKILRILYKRPYSCIIFYPIQNKLNMSQA